MAQPVLWRPQNGTTLYDEQLVPYNENMGTMHRAKRIKDPYYWLNAPYNETAIAKIAFVEIQAPVLDSVFFEYLLEKVKPMPDRLLIRRYSDAVARVRFL